MLVFLPTILEGQVNSRIFLIKFKDDLRPYAQDIYKESKREGTNCVAVARERQESFPVVCEARFSSLKAWDGKVEPG